MYREKNVQNVVVVIWVLIKKTCSHYVAYQSLCDECGAPKSTHKRKCSKYKPITVCKECHKRNGNHTSNCSQNNP